MTTRQQARTWKFPQISKPSNVSSTMKWRQRRPGEVRPFLVLPLLEDQRSLSADPTIPSPRKTSSGTSTSTWPPKLKLKIKKKDKQKSYELERPLTATLERPELLNINLLDKLDMSLVRKEFLCITNLCKETVNVAVVTKTSKRGRFGKLSPPVISVMPSDKNKRSRKPETSEDSLSDENSSVRRRRKITKVNKLNNKASVRIRERNDANNNSTPTSTPTPIPVPVTVPVPNRSLRRSKFPPSPNVSPKLVDILTPKPQVLRSSLPLPEPCKTCGRPDAPERFHSHPATPLTRHKNPPVNVNKSSVQKPVAIKYKSREKSKSPVKTLSQQEVVRKTPEVVRNTPEVVRNTPEVVKNTPEVVRKTPEVPKKKEERARSPMKTGPRTVTCYLCGREFGTKSLPLHEPKCLQKWERENSDLPRHLQRKAPVKPDKPMSPEEWNKFAWEASQASLAQCPNCGRTFLPDRLIVHQRSCKPKPGAHLRQPPPQPSQRVPVCSSSGGGDPSEGMPHTPPGTIECYICGRKFGSRSIAIHEPQCLKKWHAENDKLPPGQRRPPPVRHAEHEAPAVQAIPHSSTAAPSGSGRPPSGPRKPMLPCYICGREFGTSSIYIHEPQCLKKWRLENDKLPLSQRRAEPQRPDIKFTASGKVDYGATNEALWQSHLSQLIACKMCGRTFNPDRVVVHERSCKGQ